jgi:hypothetical protein
VFYAVSKHIEDGSAQNYVGTFVYHIKRPGTFFSQVPQHDWVVSPPELDDLGEPTNLPPCTVDIRRLTPEEYVSFNRGNQYCMCIDTCYIQRNPVCTNHLLRQECGLSCNSRHCNNRRLLEVDRTYPRLYLQDTTDKGVGVFVFYMDGMLPLCKYDIVCEFAGVCSTAVQTNIAHHCILEIIRDEYYLTCVDNKSDPLFIAQYINHSCDPNCNIEVWIDSQGWPRVLVVARQNLESGVELTVNYNMSLCHSSSPQVCKCGTSRCKGFIAAPMPSSIDNPPVVAELPLSIK